MRLINLTPHPVTLRIRGAGVNYGEEATVTLPSSGLARLEVKDYPLDPMAIDDPAWPDGGYINVAERSFGDIVGLPAPAERTIYIVSLPVAQRAAELGRTDVYAPDTGPSALRDAKGNILAVTGLVRFTARRRNSSSCWCGQVSCLHQSRRNPGPPCYHCGGDHPTAWCEA
jgi:hypothetical protein